MLVVGLLGGIASGKSHVARLLVERGAELLDADRAGHEVLREPEVRQALIERWGEQVLSADGEINRRAIAAMVFADTPLGREELAWLESVSHPRIRAKLEARVAELRKLNVPLAILDAPVMLKSGWDRICDVVIYVETPEPIRRARALERGWTADEFSRREAAQEALDVKRRRADIHLDNSRDAGYIGEQVERVWRQLIGSSSPDFRPSP